MKEVTHTLMGKGDSYTYCTCALSESDPFVISMTIPIQQHLSNNDIAEYIHSLMYISTSNTL